MKSLLNLKIEHKLIIIDWYFLLNCFNHCYLLIVQPINQNLTTDFQLSDLITITIWWKTHSASFYLSLSIVSAEFYSPISAESGSRQFPATPFQIDFKYFLGQNIFYFLSQMILIGYRVFGRKLVCFEFLMWPGFWTLGQLNELLGVLSSGNVGFGQLNCLECI